jgi:hypothetical protein
VDYVTPCPGTIYVDDQTDRSPLFYVTEGVSYGLSNVSFGACGTYYSSVWTIWVDFNRNNAFDTNEAVHTGSGAPQTPVTFSLPSTFPGGVSGPTRMRLMLREGGTLPLNPCATFTWGSVVDMPVMVTVPPPPTPTPTRVFSVPDSFADGPGLVDTVLNRVAVFTIYAMLDDNTHMSVGGVVWTANLYGHSTFAVAPVNVTDYNDGTYGARYVLAAADTYTLYISTGTQQIKNSPLTIRGTSSESEQITDNTVSAEDRIASLLNHNLHRMAAPAENVADSVGQQSMDSEDESAELSAIVAEH